MTVMVGIDRDLAHLPSPLLTPGLPPREIQRQVSNGRGSGLAGFFSTSRRRDAATGRPCCRFLAGAFSTNPLRVQMPFDLDVRDAPFTRPAATIRISGPDGEELTIECPEFTIDPEPLTIDYAAQRAAAATIVENSPFAAADIAVNVQSTNPVLALEIRRALERRATRPQQPHTTPRSY